MQKEPRPGTPKHNATRKPRNSGTPDNRLRNASGDITMPSMNRTTNFRQRGNVASADIVIPPGLFTKRRIANAARLNATLSQPPAQAPVKAEIECPDTELGLLYDKYLQAKAAEILLKKKIADKERAISIQILAASRERGVVKDKFGTAKARENDIRNFNIMQNSIDKQTTDITACFDDLRKNNVKEKLLELKTLLEPMDELRCEGIVVPDNAEDSKELFKTLEDIGEVLKRVQESSGEKGSVYRDLENGLNNLINKQVEIECVKKKFDEILCGLQVLVLKDASHSLSQNYVDELD